jgi:hypothetical protein
MTLNSNTATLSNGFNQTSNNPNSMHLRSIYYDLSKVFADRFLWSNLRWAKKTNEGLYWTMNNTLTENNILLSTSYEDLNKKNKWSDRWIDEEWFYNLFNNITGDKNNIRKLFIFSSALLPTEWFTYFSLANDLSVENKISTDTHWAYCLGMKNINWISYYTFLEFDVDWNSNIVVYDNNSWDWSTIHNPSARTITFQDRETD